ncbi:MAG: hypothetical protein AMK73_04680 [Planctomycetes bacterium SM23_32]|nr:MAG: hypothetical protein AMK73_04680 [Planctomycetes bacterium SM23_32]
MGSRFNLIFDPRDHCAYQNAYGDFREQPLDLVLGIKTAEGAVWALPFTRRAEHFPFVEQFGTLTSIVYRAVHPGLGVEFVVRVRSPFYPRDARISTAPFHYVDVQVSRRPAFRWERCESPLEAGELVFELSGSGVEFARCEQGFRYAFTSSTPAEQDGEPLSAAVECWVEAAAAEAFGASGLRRPFNLADGRKARMNLIWSHWQPEPILEVFEQRTPFKYLSLFDSRREMVAWARAGRAEIDERCDLLDHAVEGWSLSSSASDLAALALHSLLVDSWWTTRRDGRDWFSVWEGSCFYHSTIDVEYNDALLYFALWPELLEMLLDEWADFEVDGSETLGPAGKGSSFLCHDMGRFCRVGRQGYPHHMEVEENADYLLLLSAWASFTGNVAKAAGKLALCRRLGEFLVEADSTGNGVPDRGVANTVDDAGPAVQYGREQVYLAVKTQAALWALADLEQKCEAKDSLAERWRAFTSKSVKTVEDEAWLGDHYATALARTTEGLTDPWTGEPLPPGELAGWDAYSIYTANGLLYLFLAGIKMPRWKRNRLAADIEAAAGRTMTPYGCRHSSAGERTVWFSQNMWRDYVAAYLGVDMLGNVSRYWSYQAATGDNWRSSLYYDTTDANNLNFYPRGATVFGMPMSAAGLRLSRADGELTLAPVRTTLSVPLLPLADWAAMRIPVLTVRQREGVASARLSERGLLEGLTPTVVGAELEPD